MALGTLRGAAVDRSGVIVPTISRRLLTVLAPIALAAILTGCGGSSSAVELPSSSDGCKGAVTSGGKTTIPVTVSDFDEGKAVFANVCVDGKGPFPFFVDTGSAGSEIDGALAEELHLRGVGRAQVAGGVGCSFTTRPVRMPAWSVAGIPLEGQSVGAVDDAAIYEASGAVGTIGSDVLARFGAVRIAYKAETMTVEGGEGEPIGGLVEAAKAPLPKGLVTGTPKIVAPMFVQALPGSVTMRVGVRFGRGKPLAFLPDTGAPRAGYIDPVRAKALGLKENGKHYKQRTFCSTSEDPGVESGEWSIAGKPLKPQPLPATPLIKSVLADGLIGGTTFDEYGSVVFDYAGERLVLGAG
ncbi:MAG TPA: retropepsin-like aspartic protease [Solirubrobacterales bacterium]|nr:retropepsin-like aspartic protease [Solirubrobacterales bacterium]